MFIIGSVLLPTQLWYAFLAFFYAYFRVDQRRYIHQKVEAR